MKIDPFSHALGYAMILLGVGMVVSVLAGLILAVSMFLSWTFYPLSVPFYIGAISYNLAAWFTAVKVEALRREAENTRSQKSHTTS